MPARAAAACTGPGWADRGVARSLIANYANYGNRGIITGVAGGAVTGQTRAAGVVGRDRQLAALLAALDAVGDGPVGCTVHGPAGIGKTVLWRVALADAAERGYRVLSCRPAESEAGLSFAGLRDLVDDGPDSLLATLPDRQREALEIALLRRASDGAPPGPRAVPVALLSVVRALTDAAPVVLAVDDAQWLDSPTAQAIEYVAGDLTREPVCLLVTARGDGEPPFGLAQTLGAGRLTRIALTGLNADALHTLNFFIDPLGSDFIYTTASGNSYLATSADPSVPEPSTILLLGTGVASLARRMRRLTQSSPREHRAS